MSEQFNQSDEEISLQEYIQIIRKRKWIIFLVFISALFLAFLANYIIAPVYKATTTVLISENNSPGQLLSDNEMGFLMGRSDNIETQVEIIKSRKIAEEVVSQFPLDLFQTIEKDNFQRRVNELRWFIDILDFLRLKQFAAGFVSNIAEEENLDADKQAIRRRILSNVRNSLSANLVRDTNIIEISSENIHPELAADIANKSAEVYVEQSRSFNRTQATAAKSFIEKQLASQEKELRELEEEKLSFKKRENILYLDEETRLNLEQLAKYEAQRIDLDTQITGSQVRLEQIKKQLQEHSKTIVSSQTISANPVVQQLQNRLVDLQIQLPSLKERYSENSPQVTEIEIQIRQIENELSQKVAEIISSSVSTMNPIYQNLLSERVSLESNIISLEARLNSTVEVIKNYETRLEQLPEKELQLARLERGVRVAENTYLLLLESYQEARISEAMEMGNIRIIDQALVPTNPIKPRKLLNLAIGGVLGIMLGVMLVFFMEFFDYSFKSKDDVEKYLELPVLGVIPLVTFEDIVKRRKRKKTKSKKIDSRKTQI